MSWSTLAFVDVECTGVSHPQPPTRITELAVIALDTSHMGSGKNNLDANESRVLNRLTLCFQPRATVSLTAKQMSGLDNLLLESQPPFDQRAVKLWSAFLGRLRKPVALVAHNGHSLDFPLIKAELLKAWKSNSSDDDMDNGLDDDLEDVFVVDSLQLMRDICDKDEGKGDGRSHVDVAPMTPPPSSGKRVFDEEDEEDDQDNAENARKRPRRRRLLPHHDDLPNANNEREEEPLVNPLPRSPLLASADSHEDNENNDADVNDSDDEIELESFVTPEKTVNASPSILQPPRLPRKKERTSSSISVNGRHRVRKRLDFNRPSSFQLAHLYHHFCGGQVPSRQHRAEADCETLMRLFTTEWNRIEPKLWAFASPWKDVKPLWTQRHNGPLQSTADKTVLLRTATSTSGSAQST